MSIGAFGGQGQGGMPPGLPPEVVQSLVNRLITPGPAAPGQPPPGTQPGGPVPDAPPQAAPSQGPPPGANPSPQRTDDATSAPPGPKEADKGLNDDQAEAMKTLMADPEARQQIQKIARLVAREGRGSSEGQIDPTRRLQLAQGWNARVGELAFQMNAARSQNPGASAASDEALLRIYYMTPIAPWAPKDAPFPIPIEDIDEYADQVRLHLVGTGWTDIDTIEDQTARECFPLREPLIAAGRNWEQRVDFVDQMLLLTERWLRQYGDLPTPDLEVLRATRHGKGDPESQARDTDSSAYPPGGYRNPPKPTSSTKMRAASSGKRSGGAVS